MRYRLTKSLTFVAAHRLMKPEWTAERNAEMYGKCARLHGHDYTVEATVTGPLDPEGFVLNLSDLKSILVQLVYDRCDHQFLNELDLFDGMPTTVENIAREFFHMVDHEISEGFGDLGVKLDSLTVHESPSNRCEVMA